MRPIICSFYTPEYEDLAERMAVSATRFRYALHVVPMAKVNGSWLDTIYSRPKFIRHMLELHRKPVVWLDCDAIVEQDPVLFEDATADFMIHIRPRPRSWAGPRIEYLGGTMYFAFNDRVMTFLDNWIRLNQELPRQPLSQWVIPYAIEVTPGLVVQELPAAYTQIFDLMKGEGGAPVISHHQASRRFRDG